MNHFKPSVTQFNPWRFKKCLSALAVTLFFIISSVCIPQAIAKSSVFGRESIFQFSDHLRYAEAWVHADSGSETRGIWKVNRFLFPGKGEEAEIREVFQTFDDGNEKVAIRLNTLEGLQRILLFEEVPPGNYLQIAYEIMSERGEHSVSYVNFRIWLGQNMLKELRLENKRGEGEVEIPLGIYSFLNRPGSFRFEVFSDSEEPIFFNFDAQITV